MLEFCLTIVAFGVLFTVALGAMIFLGWLAERGLEDRE